MISAGLKWIFTLHLLTGFAHSQTIVTPPADATAIEGTTASFDCDVIFKLIEEITWEFNDNFVYSFFHGNEDYSLGSTKYSVQRTGSTFTLTIKELSLTDGGTFTCTSNKASAAAVLLVFGVPVITSHPQNPVAGEKSSYKCETQFGGPNKDSISPDHYPQLQIFSEDSWFNQLMQDGEYDYVSKEDHLIVGYRYNNVGHLHINTVLVYSITNLTQFLKNMHEPPKNLIKV